MNQRYALPARQLRANSKEAEAVLWNQLRGHRLNGAKFRRQHPIGPNYIVDFYCAAFSLAIELDGSVHDSNQAKWADGIRHRQIQHAGVRILRFTNEDVMNDVTRVSSEIREYLCPTSETDEWVWIEAKHLEVGSGLLLEACDEIGEIENVEDLFSTETVYDLTVEGDHSFITEIGIAHNCD